MSVIARERLEGEKLPSTDGFGMGMESIEVGAGKGGARYCADRAPDAGREQEPANPPGIGSILLACESRGNSGQY